MVLVRAWTLSLLPILLVATRPAWTAENGAPRHYDLRNSQPTFLLAETGVAAGAFVTAWLITGGPRKTCRWCETDTFDRGARDALRARDPRPAALISHGLSLGAVPALSLTGLIAPAGVDHQWHRAVEDTWIVTNAFFITTAVGEAVKNAVARERPSFHYRVQGHTEFASYPSEHNKSFFSLDTAWAFVIASSSTTLAYLRGYSTAPYIAIGGGLLAAGAGTLRIVGDAHWATDVLTGAAVGTAIGIALPMLLHTRRNDGTSGEPAANGAAALATSPSTTGPGVSLAFRF